MLAVFLVNATKIFKQVIKFVFEHLTVCEVELWGGKSSVVISKSRHADMWFHIVPN